LRGKFKGVALTITLTSLLLTFAVGSTNVTPTSTTYEYDPWADINEDGKIDIWDVAYTARLFGTSGNVTKNVYIVGGTINVTFPPKPLQTYRETVKITVLPAGALTTYSESERELVGGVWLSRIQSTLPPATFVFTFNPKGELLNVTDLWITILVNTQMYHWNASFEITLNNATVEIVTSHFLSYYITTAISLRLSSLAREIVQGINRLEIKGSAWELPKLEGSSAGLLAHGIDLFITYEYQA